MSVLTLSYRPCPQLTRDSLFLAKYLVFLKRLNVKIDLKLAKIWMDRKEYTRLEQVCLLIIRVHNSKKKKMQFRFPIDNQNALRSFKSYAWLSTRLM